jgi:hypothetical protein
MKYSTPADQAYKAKRDELVSALGSKRLWEIVDHWPLYCGVGTLARQLAIIDIFRSTLDVPGHLAEFGMWRGATTLLLGKLLFIEDPLCSKVVHGFDSFEGLAAFSASDGDATAMKGHYQGSRGEIQSMMDLYGLGDIIDIHEGRIETTLPELLEQHPEMAFSFVYLDTDLFESTRTILDHVHPRLSKGGVFVFDEWNHPTYPGEGLAINDFLHRHGDKYEVSHVANTRQPSMFIKKIAY